MKRIALLVSLGAVAAGCSILVDNDPFLGNGDAGDGGGLEGGLDGGFDAGPDAPTVPVVHIEPADPRTLDDLTVVIDTESTDPLMAGAITYEYRWLRDTVDSGESGTTVDNSLTARDEVWRVEVTPVTADMRRGNAGTDEVTIGNTPPVLLTVGLSDYRPIVGEELVALPGPITDADGDATTIIYEWTVDGSPVTGATSSRFAIRDGVVAPDAVIRVRARAADDTDMSPPVGAGPAIVVADVTRWNQLLPDRGSIIASRLDGAHHRVVMIVDGFLQDDQLWEHDLTSDRFVRLRPTGTYDEANLFNAGMSGGGRLWAAGGSPFVLDQLDMRARGEEDWSQLNLDSASAPAGLAHGGVFDEVDEKLYVLVEEAAGDVLVSFDLTTDPVVATREIEGIMAPIRLGAWAIDPVARQALVFGGFSTALAVSDTIHRLDLDDPSTIVEISSRLPRPAIAQLAHFDAESGRYIVGFGVDSSFGVEGELYTFDLSTGTFETVDTSAGPPPGLVGWAGTATDGSLLITGGRRSPFQEEDYELFEIDRSDWRTSGRHEMGVDLPPALERAAGHFDSSGRFLVYGGRGWDDYVSGELFIAPFALSAAFTTFQPFAVAPDPSEGSPGPRFGQVVGEHSEFVVWGGGTDSADRVGGTAFRLNDTAWTAQQLAVSSGPPPSARVGSVIFEACSNSAIYGGTTATATPSNEIWSISCAARDSECSWSSDSPAGAPARSFAAISGNGVLYGGIGAAPAGTLSDAYELSGCRGTWAWTPLTVSSPIGPRHGHSIVRELLFGGSDASDLPPNQHAEVYRMNTGGTNLTFEEIVPAMDGDGIPGGRSFAAVAHDPSDARLVVYGGFAGRLMFLASRPRRLLADMWELRYR